MDCDLVKILFLVSLIGNCALFFWAIWQRDEARRRKNGKEFDSLMRAVKFRVWNNQSRQMFPVDKIIWDDRGKCHPIKDESYLIYSDDDKIMQSIGLRDIEGTEIYEGDIVEFQTFDAVEPVIFVPPCFKTTNHNLAGYEVKIIGNIYEDQRIF